MTPGRAAAVVAGREDVREHREVEDLLQGLVAVRELQELEVGVGHEHVLRLAAFPAAHVHVPVGGSGSCGVDVQADVGLALVAHATPPAGDVERHGADVALLDEHARRAPRFDDLADDLVPEGLARGGGGAASDHVLVAAADVRGDDLEDDAVGRCLLDAEVFRDLVGVSRASGSPVPRPQHDPGPRTRPRGSPRLTFLARAPPAALPWGTSTRSCSGTAATAGDPSSGRRGRVRPT